jgi:hypothetical protein
MPLLDYRTQVNDLAQDRDQVVAQAAVDRAIAAAVLRYSQHFPRRLYVDAVALDSALQPLPAGWVHDVSTLIELEHPLDRVPKSAVVTQLRQGPSGLMLEPETALPVGVTYRVGYTAPHDVNEANDTDSVPPAHRYAVSCLAAAIVCGQLAAHYATEGASTIGADSADHVGKTERFRARKRDLEAEFARALGISDKPASQGSAAGTVVGGDRRRPGRLFDRGRR